MKIFKILCCVFFTSLFVLKPTLAQGTLEDQYKQMGGLAGLSEMCSAPKNLEKVLFQRVGQVFYNNPDGGRYMTKLLNLYFESYDVAIQKKVMWIGQTQSYNKKPLTCSEKDKKTIANFETMMLQGFQNQ